MIVPVAAVAETVATSAELVRISASTDDVPAKDFVPVKVSTPPNVARVPVVGKVTLVAAVSVRV